MHGLKNPQIARTPVSSYILLWEWTLVERWATVFTKNSILPKLLMPCVLTSTAGYSKVLFSMENAQIMLEMAAKCSNYAETSGLCFPFWIILFEADYAKNYASILYQCLAAPRTCRGRNHDRYRSHGLWLPLCYHDNGYDEVTMWRHKMSAIVLSDFCIKKVGSPGHMEKASFLPHAWVVNTCRTSADTLPCQSAQKHLL